MGIDSKKSGRIFGRLIGDSARDALPSDFGEARVSFETGRVDFAPTRESIEDNYDLLAVSSTRSAGNRVQTDRPALYGG